MAEADRFPTGPTADGQFHILKQIGEGGYGTVFLVQHPTWGEVVLKKLRAQNGIGADDLDMLQHEADILKNLRHPNIVTLYDVQFDREFCGLFLEHVKYGSVDSFLKEFSVSVEWKMQIIHDIASAMTYLHDRQPPIIHGDLKSQNVLIGNEFHAKICDFGLARMHKISKSITAHPLKGTLEYIPPEYISDPRKRKTDKFDVYSYGILVWEILSQKRAYHDFCDKRLIQGSVERGERPLIEDIVGETNDTVVKILQDCWHQNVEVRPTFRHIRNSLHDETVPIQNKIKESWISLVEQQRNQLLGTNVMSQEQKPQDSGVSLNNSTEQKTSKSSDIQLIGRIAITSESSPVHGVAWLENKIYVVCGGSNLVHVYPDEEPFEELEDDRIEIKEMTVPWDMAASRVNRSIFISGYGNRCIWRIQMPSKEISRWEIDGWPRGLSINSSDELIVVVDRDGRRYIDLYRCEDGGRIKEVDVGVVVLYVLHVAYVVESSNGNFIIGHPSRDDDLVYLISEVSIDGRKIIRTFDPRSIESNELKDWSPEHLSIDEDDNIFVADYRNARVVQLNPRLDEHQILVNRDQHQIDRPWRLCYVRHKQMLIVGHGCSPSSVSLFSLSKHRP